MQYFTGTISLREQDVAGGGYGLGWGHARVFTNGMSDNFDRGQGWNWNVEHWPYLNYSPHDGSSLVLLGRGGTEWFRDAGDGTFETLHGAQSDLKHDAAAGEYTLAEPDGTLYRFNDFSHEVRPGLFKSVTSAGGLVTAVTDQSQSDIITVSRSSAPGGVTEQFHYEFADSGPHLGQLAAVTLRRRTGGGSWDLVLRAEYAYYGDGEAHGALNDLKTVVRFEHDGAWRPLDTRYYRYWKDEANGGMKHGLKYVVGPEAFARLDAAVLNPYTASDAVVAQYADHYFEYDDSRRATLETVRGGSRTMTFEYHDNPDYVAQTPKDPNAWFRRTTETRADGSEVAVYCNAFGQTMLRVERDGADEWVRYTRFDARGRAILDANPSAVSGYDESLTDLVGYDEHTRAAAHLRADAGLISTTSYHPDGSEAAGLAASRGLSRGTGGGGALLRILEYAPHAAGGRTVRPLSRETVYHNQVGPGGSPSSHSGGSSTSYSHVYHPGTVRVAAKTTHLPFAPEAEGGTGTAETVEERFDLHGFPTWSRDARGFITRYSHDVTTGALVQRIEDVDAALVPDAPAGWSTPAGGGRHLVTDFRHDRRGRTTRALGPEHEALVDGAPARVRAASWTVHEDGDRRTVSAAGYRRVADGSDVLANPVSITQRDRHGNVLEEIAAKATVGGPPRAGDSYAQSDYVAWTTHAYTDCCKLAATRVYHAIPAGGEGTAGTHYDETAFGYDLRDRRDRVVSPGGTISVTTFDALGRPTASYVGTDDTGATAADPAGGGGPGNDMVLLSENQYDGGLPGGDGNLTRVTQFVDDATTRVVRHQYDWRNRRTATLGEEDSCSLVEYDNLDRPVRTERRHGDAAGRLLAREETFRNDRGQVYKSVQHEVDYDTGALGGSIVRESEYDAAGNLLRQTHAGGAEFLEYAYDALGRRVSETDPLGHARTTAYDAAGNAVGMTDRVGETATRAYDPLGRLAKSTDPLGHATTFGYDDAGRQHLVTDPRGDSVTSAFDDAGRVIAATDAAGKATSFVYDANGNQVSVTDPLGHTTAYEYDHRDRLVKTTDSAGAVTRQAYNRVGDLLTETDAKGNDTTYAYDGLGRRTATTDRLNHVTTFAYDALGRQITLTDAEGGVTAYAFDGYGRPASTTWPDHAPGSVPGDAGYGITTTEHDEYGRLIRSTDQLGDTVTHLYDAAGRRTTRVYRAAADSPTGPIADQDDFTYDAEGRLLTGTKGRYANAIAYVYDAAGRIASESLTTNGRTYVIGRGYDASGNLSQLTYPDGTVVDRPHDARGLLEKVDYDGSLVASFGYDAAGRETTRTFGNGLVTTTSYVPDENLLESLATPGVGSYAYSYDENKNRTAETITGPMSDYGYSAAYDAEDRLVEWDRSDGLKDQSWLLTAVGDWDQFTEEAITQSRTHNDVHELTAIDGQALTYDAKGNLTSDHLGRSFVWDRDNMLKSCTISATATVGQEGTHSYAYDAIGRRVSKTVDNNDSTFSTTVFSELTLPIPPLGTPGGQTLCEYAAGAAATSPQRSYAFGSYCDEPLVMDDGLDLHYYHRDGRYSIVAVTDSAGAVEERSGYNAYGERVIVDSVGAPFAGPSVGAEWGYTARRHQEEIGLQYFRARYYAVELGRFLGRDLMLYTRGTFGLYEYVAGTPLFAVDPSGMQGHGPHKLSMAHRKRIRVEVSRLKKISPCIADATGMGDLLDELATLSKRTGFVTHPKMLLGFGGIAAADEYTVYLSTGDLNGIPIQTIFHEMIHVWDYHNDINLLRYHSSVFGKDTDYIDLRAAERLAYSMQDLMYYYEFIANIEESMRQGSRKSMPCPKCQRDLDSESPKAKTDVVVTGTKLPRNHYAFAAASRKLGLDFTCETIMPCIKTARPDCDLSCDNGWYDLYFARFPKN